MKNVIKSVGKVVKGVVLLPVFAYVFTSTVIDIYKALTPKKK